MGYQQYFTNLKADMEEKRKNWMKPGGSGGGGGGGGPRRDPFVYFTKAQPSNWGPAVSTYGGGFL